MRQAKRYAENMRDTGDTIGDVLQGMTRLLPDVFGTLRPADVVGASVVEVLTAAKALHFVMQEIVTPSFSMLADDTEQVEQEASVFDDYDEENGYNEAADVNPWETCLEILDTITQASIKILRESFSETMNEELIPLIQALKYAIDHQPEKEG